MFSASSMQTSLPRGLRNFLSVLFVVYTFFFVFADLYRDPFQILIFLLILFGMLCLFIGVVRSLLCYLFVVCPLLFFTDLTRNPYYTQIELLNILVAALWLVWIYQAWRQKELVWVASPLDLPLLALIIISVLSWLASFVQHRLFFKPIYSEGSKGFIFLMVNTYLVYAAALRSQDRELFKRLLWISYAVSVFASVYGIAQYFGTEWIWPHSLNPYGSRPVSTFGNPNFMSSYLIVVMAVMIGDYLQKATDVPRPLLFIAILTDLGALLATLTRSSWAGLLVAVVIVIIGSWSHEAIKPDAKRALWILLVAMFLVTMTWPKGEQGAYSATVINRIAEVKEVTKGAYGPVSQRFLIWLSAWSMVEDHPFLGKGWGCLELFYPFYQGPLLLEPRNQTLRTHANNAHDEILEYWSQTGGIGLGIVIWLWVVFFGMSLSIGSRLSGPWKSVHWGLAGGVAGMLIDNLLNVSIHFAVPAFMFWWWVGSLFVLDPEARVYKRFNVSSAVRASVLGLSAVLLLVSIVRSFCMWEGEVHFFEGFKLSKANTNLATARQNLERAYFWHHLEVNNDYELGNVYARMGQQNDAVAMYHRALDANAGYDEIYFNLATILMQAGHYPEAITDYRICLDINPLSHEAYNALATIYMKDFKLHAADLVKLYERGLIVFPEDKDMWNNLGYVYTQSGDYEKAYQAYRKAVELDPEFGLAKRNLNTMLARTAGHASDPIGRLDATYAQIEQLMAQKRWDEALAQTRALLGYTPRSYRLQFYLGNILFNKHQLPEAAAAYEETVRLKPDAVIAWQNLGVTYDQLGRTNDALAAYQKVAQLDPNNAVVKARLGISSAH